jgi:thymidylate synthase
MNKADKYFIDNVIEILEEGYVDQNPRPKYESDGAPAHSQYITQVIEKYNITKGEFPITNLRPIGWKSAIKEILWIYQDQTSSLPILKRKYGINWWDSWEVENSGSIGVRYGETVHKHNLMTKLLNSLRYDKYSRRHIMNLWQEDDFKQSKGLLPCAYETIWSVRTIDGIDYLDMTLMQR